MTEMTCTSDITVDRVRGLDGDRAIAGAAWQTTGKDADAATDDEVRRLIGMLMRGRHGSAFEFGALHVRVHCPVFVLRQWQRHRIGWGYAELSGRWHRPGSPPPLEPVFWVPRWERPMQTAAEHKPTAPQFSTLTRGQCDRVCRGMGKAYRSAWREYSALLKLGIAAEVARAVLPLGIYTRCEMMCNPRSVMHYLELRTAGQGQHPQWEIEEAARQLESVFAAGWPMTYREWDRCGRIAP